MSFLLPLAILLLLLFLSPYRVKEFDFGNGRKGGREREQEGVMNSPPKSSHHALSRTFARREKKKMPTRAMEERGRHNQRLGKNVPSFLFLPSHLSMQVFRKLGLDEPFPSLDVFTRLDTLALKLLPLLLSGETLMDLGSRRKARGDGNLKSFLPAIRLARTGLGGGRGNDSSSLGRKWVAGCGRKEEGFSSGPPFFR